MPSRSGLSAAEARNDFITELQPPLRPGAPPPAATAAAATAAGRRREWRGGGRRRQLDPVGQIALDGGDGGLAVGRRERAAADEVGRARHHQPEIGRVGAAEIAR